MEDESWTYTSNLQFYSFNLQIFIGNVDKPSIVKNILPTKVTAVAIRIVPVTYHRFPTLRVELYHVPFPAGLFSECYKEAL